MKLKLIFFLVTIVHLSNAQPSKMEQLGKLYMSGNIEETINRADEYLEEEPDNIDYKLILGRALTDYGEYKKALPYLIFTIENDAHNSWRKAWALGYVGSCYYMLNKHENSKQALKECVELNATGNATDYATNQFLQFGYYKFFDDWEIIESENFRFHFQKMNEEEKKEFVDSRENAYKEINKFFQTELPKKIDFFVWNSRADAKMVLRRDLGFSRSEYCIIHSHFQQTRGHEMTHVISNFLGKNMVKTGLINEGTAVCFNLDKQDKQALVEKWMENNKMEIDIKAMWLAWEDYPVELTYPFAGIFVEDLIKTFGKDKFLNFLTDQSYGNAKKVFGDELDTVILSLEAKFNKND